MAIVEIGTNERLALIKLAYPEANVLVQHGYNATEAYGSKRRVGANPALGLPVMAPTQNRYAKL